MGKTCSAGAADAVCEAGSRRGGLLVCGLRGDPGYDGGTVWPMTPGFFGIPDWRTWCGRRKREASIRRCMAGRREGGRRAGSG